MAILPAAERPVRPSLAAFMRRDPVVPEARQDKSRLVQALDAFTGRVAALLLSAIVGESQKANEVRLFLVFVALPVAAAILVILGMFGMLPWIPWINSE